MTAAAFDNGRGGSGAQDERNSLAHPVGPDYAEAWARELARPAAHAAGGAATEAAMVFRIGVEWLAVPLALAALVAPSATIHRLPHRGGGPLLGIAAADGKLLPAVSLARLLDIDTGAAAAATPVPASAGRHAFARLLVLAEPGAAGAPAFALPVDEVHGVLRYAGAALRPPAATVGRAPPTLVAAVLAGVIDGIEPGLLDAAPLLAALKGALR
jgi:chemotaxis-related protein WspD